MIKNLCTLLAACSVMTAANATPPFSPDDWLNPMLYPKDSQPFGKSITSWAELNWQWIYAQPFAHNPYLDPTCADCAVGQAGPVWQLAADRHVDVRHLHAQLHDSPRQGDPVADRQHQ